ncbi:potassium channel family protein [Nocardia halotolerans]|uniref:Potassium channel family protein n=1 Tax=Nocardia halotolerans TaxID=1755878 RepID=A0ABV8VK57_9NOCA
MTPGRFFPGHAQRNGAAALFTLLFYYSVPVGRVFEVDAWPGQAVGVLAFFAGVAGLGWMVWRRVQTYLRAPTAAGGQVDGLLLIVCVVGAVFALFYYRLQQLHPDQFVGLETRTDALYYTLVTLGTVGYGDVRAVGQAARVVTMVQIVFDLVVLGTLLTIITSSVTGRIRAATAAANKVSGDEPGTTR